MYNFEEHTSSFGHWQEKKENNKVSSQPAATYFLMIIASKLQSLAHIFSVVRKTTAQFSRFRFNAQCVEKLWFLATLLLAFLFYLNGMSSWENIIENNLLKVLNR